MVEDFTNLALSAGIEVLRVANLLSGTALYRWRIITLDGISQKSSNGLVTLVEGGLQDLRSGTQLYVVSGLNAQENMSSELRSFLRYQDRHGVQLGAICSGAYIFAQAGLPSGKSCTVHWEYHPMSREEFPGIHLSEQAFCADARPYTASGGSSPLALASKVDVA